MSTTTQTIENFELNSWVPPTVQRVYPPARLSKIDQERRTPPAAPEDVPQDRLTNFEPAEETVVVRAKQNWNEPSINKWRLMATFISYALVGANDAAYGVGGYRLSLLKAGGTPGAKAFTIAATLASDAGAKILNNTINDPSYVKNHYNSWSFIWKDLSKGEASVTVDEDTSNKLSNIISNNNKLIGGDDGLYDLSQALINGAFERLKFILEPVQVNYSNEISWVSKRFLC